MSLTRGHARRRRQMPWLAWLASLAALAVTGWMLWRARPHPPKSSVGAPSADEQPEITQDQQRSLDEILRAKRAEHGQ
ncbi:MAG TPA: hypothetical protein VMW17_19475 [Candidatus Binatia bacterium]|nr:hypothetical protein [Candidatus Binatia bacterium]